MNAFFPVESQPLNKLLQGQYLAKDKQAIVNMETNEVLGIHSHRYRMIKNSDLCEAVSGAIHSNNSLDTTRMKTFDCVSGQSKFIRTYVFHGNTVDINPGVGDIVSLRMRITNSYDGSLPVSIIVDAERLACLNGMVMPKSLLLLKAPHRSGCTIDLAADQFNSVISEFDTETEKWKKWSGIPFKSNDIAPLLVKYFARVSQKTADYITKRFLEYSNLSGKTVWAFFNALTDWSTHVSEEALPNEIKALGREVQVRKVLKSPEFNAYLSA